MRDLFKEYIFINNVKGSNKASSYIRSLDMLGEILSGSKGPFKSIASIWREADPKVIDGLYEYIKVQQKSGEIFQTKHAPSYWQNGYYSAALKSYRDFLIELNYETDLRNAYKKDFDPNNFKIKPKNSKIFLKEYGKELGKDKIVEVKTRIGQSAFRSKILEIYNEQCCITGLNIPEINRASHIIPWSENENTRMDPSNGLCLSATYDAAFDKNLISLDEDYRIVISKSIKEYYSKQVVKDYFHNFEGNKINLPKTYIPKQEYLQKHRKKLVS